MTDLIDKHLTFDDGQGRAIYIDCVDGTVLIDISQSQGVAITATDFTLDAEQAKALATALKMWVLDAPEEPVMPDAG